jgi:hypothetical protein
VVARSLQCRRTRGQLHPLFQNVGWQGVRGTVLVEGPCPPDELHFLFHAFLGKGNPLFKELCLDCVRSTLLLTFFEPLHDVLQELAKAGGVLHCLAEAFHKLTKFWALKGLAGDVELTRFLVFTHQARLRTCMPNRYLILRAINKCALTGRIGVLCVQNNTIYLS